MDNKKWYKRFGTVFWWILTILPLIVALIYFIGYHLTFNSGITSANELVSYHSNLAGNFYNELQNVALSFNDFSISYLTDSFDSLLDSIGLNETTTFSILLSYMFTVQIFHLIFDLFAWLPCFFHKMLEKSNIGE